MPFENLAWRLGGGGRRPAGGIRRVRGLRRRWGPSCAGSLRHELRRGGGQGSGRGDAPQEGPRVRSTRTLASPSRWRTFAGGWQGRVRSATPERWCVVCAGGGCWRGGSGGCVFRGGGCREECVCRGGAPPVCVCGHSLCPGPGPCVCALPCPLRPPSPPTVCGGGRCGGPKWREKLPINVWKWQSRGAPQRCAHRHTAGAANALLLGQGQACRTAEQAHHTSILQARRRLSRRCMRDVLTQSPSAPAPEPARNLTATQGYGFGGTKP